MVTVIFAIISLLILTPFMLLLPVGFSKKWKLGLIGVAFLLASVGLLANVHFPLYQTILFLLLLTSLVSVLLGKRILKHAPAHYDSDLNEKKSIILERKPIHIKEDSKEPHQDFSAVIEETAAAIETAEVAHSELIESEPILEEEEILVIDELQPANSKINKQALSEEPLDIDDDIAFLENRVKDFGTGELNNTLENKEFAAENIYMSEIEKLIEADTDEELNEKLREHNDAITQGEMEELEEIHLSKFVITEEDAKAEPENNEIEIEELVFHK